MYLPLASVLLPLSFIHSVHSGTFTLQVDHNPNFTLSPQKLIQSSLMKYGGYANIDLSINLRREARGLDLNVDLGLLGVGASLGSFGLGVSGGSGELLGGLRPTTTRPSRPTSIGQRSGCRTWNGTTLVATDTNHDNAWTIKIGFGKPVQTVTMLLDSGSADVLVYGQSCSTCDLPHHPPFDKSKSSTFNSTHSKAFNVSFSDGSSFAGNTADDTISVGSLSVPDHLIGIVNSLSGQSNLAPYSGILGLGLPHSSYLNGAGTPTVLASLVLRGNLDQPLLGIRLVDTNKFTNQSGGGEYTFGAIDQRYVSGQIVYAPVVSSNFWGVVLDGIFMGGESVLSPNDFPGVMIDTGSTLILTSNATATLIHSHIPGASYNAALQLWKVPCDSSQLLITTPSLIFQIAGFRFGVPASDLAFRGSVFADGYCTSAVQGSSPRFTVLGDAFIQSHYIVFKFADGDITKPRLGMANRTDVPPIAL